MCCNRADRICYDGFDPQFTATGGPDDGNSTLSACSVSSGKNSIMGSLGRKQSASLFGWKAK